MKLVKWHGLGNDYLFLAGWSERPDDLAGLARVLSRRHHGPGADGLIVLGGPTRTDADLRMEVRNADGSDGGVCGNGLRCAAAWVVSEELVPHAGRVDAACDRVRIETPAGVSAASVEADVAGGAAAGRWMVTVELPPPRFELATLPALVPGLEPASEMLEATSVELAAVADLVEDVRWSMVSTGNPHLVARCPRGVSIDGLDLAAFGPVLERLPWFPERVNVHLVDDDSETIRMRTWERGSGVTMACGTGASAVVSSLVRAGRREASATHRVSLPGGDLEIAWSGSPEASIRMAGEAVRVCAIEVDDRWIEEACRRDRDGRDQGPA